MGHAEHSAQQQDTLDVCRKRLLPVTAGQHQSRVPWDARGRLPDPLSSPSRPACGPTVSKRRTALPVPAGPSSSHRSWGRGAAGGHERLQFPPDTTTGTLWGHGRVWCGCTEPVWQREGRGESGFQFPGIMGVQRYGASTGTLV